MKKRFAIIVFLIITNFVYSQTDDNEYSDDDETTEFETIKDKKKKLDLKNFRVGGDVALGFSNRTFYAEFSPLIGYQIIPDRLEVGPGLIYQHQSEQSQYAVNNIGGQAYIRGYIWQGIYAQVDGFMVNYNINYLVTKRKSSFTYGNGFVGAGYAFNMDAAFYFTISIKTNILTDKYYPTRVLMPKVGFQFRL